MLSTANALKLNLTNIQSETTESNTRFSSHITQLQSDVANLQSSMRKSEQTCGRLKSEITNVKQK
jgi:hypothetical protein